MKPIELDYRLDKDCIKLGYLDDSLILLMNNPQIPWLILVPNTCNSQSSHEFDLLSREQQIQLLDQINLLSKFLRQHFQFDKLNIATIGNIVRQLHIHIVARSEDDYCWPAVVWGQENNASWSNEDINNLIHQMSEFIPDQFKKCQN